MSSKTIFITFLRRIIMPIDKLSQIEGTYTDEGIERNFHTYAVTGSSNDTLLLRFLEENNVPVNHRDVKESDSDVFFILLLVAILPLILLVVLVVFSVKINRKLNRFITHQQNNSSAADQTE